MAEYSPTSIFTLIPDSFADKTSQKAVLKELFSLEDSQSVYSAPVPEYNATLVYAWESFNNGSISPSPNLMPKALKLLTDLAALSEYNKLIVDFDSLRKKTCILLAEGKKLITANSYHTVDFPTAVYYALELLNKSQINPQQTTVNFIGPVEDKEIEMLRSYFKEVRLKP